MPSPPRRNPRGRLSLPRVSPRQPPDHFPARISAPIRELAPSLTTVPFDNCHHFLECATPLPRALSGDLPVALFDLRADFLDHGDATKDRLGFDLQMGRGREGPRQFLGNFGGHLQSDGYSAYDKIGGEGIVFMGCMTHARRGFVEALKINPKESHATGIVEVIGALYAVEADAREKGMSAAERLAARQQKSVALLDELKKKIIAARREALPQSALGKACDYALGQWERLIVYAGHGEVEVCNNLCENSMRGPVLGRKNWLHFGSEEAGPRIAAIMSVIETCRRLGITEREYLNDVLPKIPSWPANRIAELTPMAWQAARTAA